MWLLWLIISGFFFILEMATTGFLVFWLGLGALLAMVVSFFTENIFIQTIVFVISSIIFIFLTKPFVDKFVTKKEKKIETNAYSIIGQKAIVTKEVNSLKGVGQINIDGDIWSAKTENDEIIPSGTAVKVIRIDGVKAVIASLTEAELKVIDIK